jgi:hypothetical protein
MPVKDHPGNEISRNAESGKRREKTKSLKNSLNTESTRLDK